MSANRVKSKRLEDMSLAQRLAVAATNLWSDCDPCVAQSSDGSRLYDDTCVDGETKSEHVTDDEDLRALKCQQMLAGDYKGRAIRALTNLHKLADVSDPQVKSKLHQMHPPRLADIPAPPAGQSADAIIQVDPECVARLMTSSNNGSSPGPSGWVPTCYPCWQMTLSA